jgi:hypothetical protein
MGSYKTLMSLSKPGRTSQAPLGISGTSYTGGSVLGCVSSQTGVLTREAIVVAPFPFIHRSAEFGTLIGTSEGSKSS